MRLLLDKDSTIQTVRSYSAAELVIGASTYRRSCIISPTQVSDWTVTSLQQLTPAALAPFLALKPQVVLLGVCATSPRASAAVRRELEQRGIALETMELGAACRTYNVLATEGRAVVAGLILPGSAPEEDTERKERSTIQPFEADRIE
jgi:uncharacterized protein